MPSKVAAGALIFFCRPSYKVLHPPLHYKNLIGRTLRCRLSAVVSAVSAVSKAALTMAGPQAFKWLTSRSWHSGKQSVHYALTAPQQLSKAPKHKHRSLIIAAIYDDDARTARWNQDANTNTKSQSQKPKAKRAERHDAGQ
jgi:hypothetical protein